MTKMTFAAFTSIPMSCIINMQEALIYSELPARPIVADIGATNRETLLSTLFLSSKLW